MLLCALYVYIYIYICVLPLENDVLAHFFLLQFTVLVHIVSTFFEGT